MKKSLLASIAFAALVAAPAMAADMGVRPAAPAYKAAPVPVAYAYNWTGCYIGAHGGYGWGRSTTDAASSTNILTDEEANDYSSSPSGAVAGGQIGCNYQFSGNLVIGVEGEGWWSGMKATTTFIATEDPGTDEIHTLQAKNLWDADLALRLGVAFDRALFYVKGGGAYGRFQYTFTDAFEPLSHNFDVTANKFGSLVGGGIEYAFLPNWTAKVEYDYLYFGNNSINAQVGNPPSLPFTPYSFSTKESKSIIKFGLNYLFGGGPVGPRY